MRRLLLLAGITLSVGAAESKAGDWWFSAGMNYRGGMKADASGSSYAQALPRTTPQNISYSERLFIQRFPTGFYISQPYYNGYIHNDGSMGAVTWDWGYDENSQYDGSTITFNKAYPTEVKYQKSISANVVKDVPANFSDTFDGQGLDLKTGFMVKQTESFQVDFCFGMATIWDANANLSGSSFAEEVTEYEYEERMDTVFSASYNVGIGLPPPVSIPGQAPPPAPYRGRPGGSLISTSPSSWDQEMRTHYYKNERHWTNRNMIDMAVDTDIYSFWLGPQIKMNSGSKVALHMTPRISLNYVDVAVNRHESFMRDYEGGESVVLQSWTDHGSESKLIFGAGITAGADLELKNGLFAGVWGGYEWLSDKVDVDVGPGSVAVDAGGYMAGASVGFRFGGDH